MGKRQGQAAMEFLMTYGWALLVVLIAIGALAFFGVLNPSSSAPESCFLGVGFACQDFKVQKSTTNPDEDRIVINVINGMGKNFDLFTIHIPKDSDTSTEVCGGFLARIAPPGDFLDGTVRTIFAQVPDIADGINCNPAHALSINCCDFASAIIGVEFCSGAFVCGTATVLPPVGTRFTTDLVITYREHTNSIVHKRIGQLSTKIEQA